MPGRIDELASAILTGEVTISDERRWLPRMHRALAVLVLIGAGLGWLIFNGYPKPGTERHEEQVIAKSEPTSASVSGTGTLAIPMPPVAGNAETEPSGSDDARRIGGFTAEPLTEEAGVVSLPPPSQPRVISPPVTEQKRVDPPAAPAPVQKPAAPAPPPKKAPEATQQIASAKPQSDPPPSSAVGKPRSAQWIRTQPAKYFTLQLFATISRDKRDQFLRQQDRKEQFVTFETMRDGVPWYAVAYGSYATQAEAKSAATSLPASVGKVNPSSGRLRRCRRRSTEQRLSRCTAAAFRPSTCVRISPLRDLR